MKVRVAPLLSLAVALGAACGGSVFTSDGPTQGGSAGAHSGQGGASTSGGAASGASAGGVIGKGGATAKGGASGVGGSKANGGTSAQGGSVSQGGVIAQGGSAGLGGFNGVGGVIYLGGSTSAGGLGGAGLGGFNGVGGRIFLGGATSAGGLGGGGFGGVGGTGGVIYVGGYTGVAGAGGAAGANGAGVCRVDSDCQLGTDCCSCFAAGPGEPTSLCKAACKQSACAAAGIVESEVACVAGRCVLARSCTPSTVLCEIVEPTCPAGQLPSIKGSCYGPCIAVGECSDVPSCKVCEEAGLSCVTIEAQAAPRYHCVSKPPACDKNPTCSCMSVCLRPYQCSAPDSTTLTCTCPTC